MIIIGKRVLPSGLVNVMMSEGGLSGGGDFSYDPRIHEDPDPHPVTTPLRAAGAEVSPEIAEGKPQDTISLGTSVNRATRTFDGTPDLREEKLRAQLEAQAKLRAQQSISHDPLAPKDVVTLTLHAQPPKKKGKDDSFSRENELTFTEGADPQDNFLNNFPLTRSSKSTLYRFALNLHSN